MHFDLEKAPAGQVGRIKGLQTTGMRKNYIRKENYIWRHLKKSYLEAELKNHMNPHMISAFALANFHI